jgi:tryptophan synthase beta chain
MTFPESTSADYLKRSKPGDGHFGDFGGRFVPEALITALDELAAAHESAKLDPEFQNELANLHKSYSGRPSIITEAKRFAEYAGNV